VTARLVALDLPGGVGFVSALRRVWDRGDAAFPVDQRLPPPAREALVNTMAPSSVIDVHGHEAAVGGGRPVEPGDALVVATSGTTGTARGVVLTHDAVKASADASSRRLDVGDHDHWLACLPLSHVGGLSVVTRALHTGTALTVLPGFDTAAVERSDATLVSLVPAVLGRVDLERFRIVLLGGSQPPADRPANTVTTYGMTESGSGVVYDGWPLDGVEVRIVDDEITLRCPMLLRTYRDGTDPLRAGWFHTGDLGHLDADGRLTVEGRRDHLIISGGENVWPETVEAVLVGHPSVADVAVSGEPDPEWGQVVAARVVPDGTSPSLHEIREHVKAQLPSFCAPHRLYIVDEIPRTALGKIVRHRAPIDD
jgi:o-succinylbenzoate---CoA ligase